jgi:hypothetical protein
MENFEALQSIDNFCKVLVKKTTTGTSETGHVREIDHADEAVFERDLRMPSEASYAVDCKLLSESEEPLVDVFDEEDYLRILVQCRCREQQVTFHPSADGITVCREECHKEKDSPETCRDICRKLDLRTDELQLGNMQFVIAKCNNNNTLEAMIPKIKK